MSDNHASTSAPRSVSVLRWISRIAAVITIVLIGAVALVRHENPLQMRGMDLFLFLCFPTAVALGMIIAWRWELVGGALAVAGWIAFLTTSCFLFGALPRDWEFLIAAAPAFLILLSGVVSRRRAKQAQAAVSSTS